MRSGYYKCACCGEITECHAVDQDNGLPAEADITCKNCGLAKHVLCNQHRQTPTKSAQRATQLI